MVYSHAFLLFNRIVFPQLPSHTEHTVVYMVHLCIAIREWFLFSYYAANIRQLCACDLCKHSACEWNTYQSHGSSLYSYCASDLGQIIFSGEATLVRTINVEMHSSRRSEITGNQHEKTTLNPSFCFNK